MAVKLFSQRTLIDSERKREIENIVKHSLHQHIVRFFGYVVSDSKHLSNDVIGYAMEYMPNSLNSVIHNGEIQYSYDHIYGWGRQAASALSWLHAKGVVHRDIKPNNMLLCRNHQTLKICDFGLTREVLDISMTYGVGTPYYSPPELFNGTSDKGRYGTGCDVYSFGITLWEMATRKTPFSEFDQLWALGNHILNNGRPALEEVSCPPLRDAIERCFSHEAANRPNMIELCHILNCTPSQIIPVSECINQFGNEERSVAIEVNEYKWLDFFNCTLLSDEFCTSFIQAEHKSLGKVVVKKYGTILNANSKDALQEELELLVKHNMHPNIIKCFGKLVELKNNELVVSGVITEFMEYGSLYDVISDPAPYSLWQALDWMVQVSSAIAWLHSRRVLYGKTDIYSFLLTIDRRHLKLAGYTYWCNLQNFRTFGKKDRITIEDELMKKEVQHIAHIFDDILFRGEDHGDILRKFTAKFRNRCMSEDVHSRPTAEEAREQLRALQLDEETKNITI